jgi:hypothetical protein
MPTITVNVTKEQYLKLDALSKKRFGGNLSETARSVLQVIDDVKPKDDDIVRVHF